jgi:hypothetical protein
MTLPNMTISGMDRWQQTEAYKEYAEYHEQNVETTEDTSLQQVVYRARQVIRYGSSSKYADKVESFINRHRAQYEKYGAGSTKYGGVPKNILALRNWGYDVYYEYTG